MTILAKADLAIWNLTLPEYTWMPEEARDYRHICEWCDRGNWEADAQDDNEDHLCQECLDETYFECEDCHDTHTLVDDRDEEHPTCCSSCGEVRREEAAEKEQEIIDNLKSELMVLVDSWDGEPTELKKIKRLLAYAKSIK